MAADRDPLAPLFAGAAVRSDRGLHLLDRREQERFVPWSELLADAAELAGGLQALGVEPGEPVALVYPTGEGFPRALFATLLAGGAPAPLPPPIRFGNRGEQQRRLAQSLAATGSRLLLCEPGLAAALGVLGAALPLGRRTLAELPPGRLSAPAVTAQTLGLVQLSSGTTGDAKAVALPRVALAHQARLLNARWPETAGFVARGVCWLPLHHDMGLVGCLLPALERAADLTLLAPEDFVTRPALWLRALSRHRATVSPAPCFGFAHCLRRVRDEELAGVDLSSWRHALCGGEPIAPQVLRAFAARFARWGFSPLALTPVYGLAEAGLAVTFGALDSPPRICSFARAPLQEGAVVEQAGGRELVSLGPPLPGCGLEIRGADGTPLPGGRVGTLWVKTPSHMSGYLGRPEDSAAVLRGGWLDTGDLGFLHGGELFLLGRVKDVVILRGRNHAAEEIEAAVAGVAGVRLGGVAALGWWPEGGEEEELLLLVEREPGGQRPAAALAAACRAALLGTLGLHAGRLVVVEAGTLPRTSSGKLRRAEALRRVLDGALGSAEPGPAPVGEAAAEAEEVAAPTTQGGAR